MSLLTHAPPGEKLRIQRLMASVHGHALRLLDGWIGIEPGTATPGEAGDSDPLSLASTLVSTFPIEGSVEGMITLRGAESAVRAIMHKLIGEPAAGEDQRVLLQETLVEVLNMMIGNATDSLRQQGLPITVFPPYASPVAHEKGLSEEPAYIRRIDTTAGPMVLIFSANGR